MEIDSSKIVKIKPKIRRQFVACSCHNILRCIKKLRDEINTKNEGYFECEYFLNTQLRSRSDRKVSILKDDAVIVLESIPARQKDIYLDSFIFFHIRTGKLCILFEELENIEFEEVKV